MTQRLSLCVVRRCGITQGAFGLNIVSKYGKYGVRVEAVVEPRRWNVPQHISHGLNYQRQSHSIAAGLVMVFDNSMLCD